MSLILPEEAIIARMIELLLGVLGVLIGAGLNALADDLPRRLRPPFPPRCANCDQPYTPRRYVALVGWLTRYRCAQCAAPVAWRAVLVEIFSAALFVFLYQKFGWTLKFGLLALLLESFLLITVIDLEHRLILYVTVIPAAVCALLYGLFGANHDWVKTAAGGAAGFGFVYLIYLLGWLFGVVAARVRGEALTEVPFGGGDVNLAGVIGLAVGWSGIVLALFWAVMIGGASAAIYLIIALARRRYNLFTPIPYGPFLVLGAVLLLVFETEIRTYYGAGS